MTNPPGNVLFLLGNYTDAEIEVNVEAEAVPPTEPLNNFFQGTNTNPVVVCW
jgi:hypothetical protein